MAYIGRGVDKISNIEVLDNITFTDSAGPYNLLKATVAFVPASPNALVISIDGIIQSPSSYTISAATITVDSVMASTSTMNFIYQIGTGLIITPGDATVNTAQLVDDAVTYAKMQNLATGNRVLGGATAGQIIETQVSNDMLAGSIANSKLANSSITVSDGSNTSPIALGGTLTFTATANETTVVENNGITLTGDASGNNFEITSTISLNNLPTAVLLRSLSNALLLLETPSSLASVISGSNVLLSSFAFGRVVEIDSNSIRDTAMLRNIALR